MHSSSPSILALDLEGTLISNAMSQFPRPGLSSFLTNTNAAFDRLVLFTAVPTPKARGVLRTLAKEGDVPEWFANVEIVEWSGKHKDLGFVPGCEPQHVILLDDQPSYVLPGQSAQHMYIPQFMYPYSEEDTVLDMALTLLLARRGGIAVKEATPADWEIARDLRLAALKQDPGAFLSRHSDEVIHHDNEAFWCERLERSHASLIAYDDTTPVGLAVVAAYGEQASDAGLYSVWTAPSVRGRSVGALMVNQALGVAYHAGCERLMLEVGEDNEPAQRLYERLGFKKTGQSRVAGSDTEHEFAYLF